MTYLMWKTTALPQAVGPGGPAGDAAADPAGPAAGHHGAAGNGAVASAATTFAWRLLTKEEGEVETRATGGQ